MAAGFKAYLHHDLRNEKLYGLPHLMNARWRGFERLWKMEQPYQSHTKSWVWRRDPGHSSFPEQFFNLGYGCMRGPSGFQLLVGRKALEIEHCTTWDSFFSNKERIQDKLRASVRLIAGLVGSPVALYFPGDAEAGFMSQLLREDASLNDALVWLQENMGFPKETLERMVVPVADGWEIKGYYLDNFLEAELLEKLVSRRAYCRSSWA